MGSNPRSLAHISQTPYKMNRCRYLLLPVVITPLFSNVSGELEYVGCYTDAHNRDLTNRTIVSARWVTPSICVTRCRNLGFLFAGVQRNSQCFCGNVFGSKSDMASLPRYLLQLVISCKQDSSMAFQSLSHHVNCAMTRRIL